MTLPVQHPGDVLNYLCDFGDDWDLTIALVEVLEREDAPDAPFAEFVTGERAAPPEDCGGRRTTEKYAELRSHPEAAWHFAGFNPAVLDTAEIVSGMGTVEWWSRATASHRLCRWSAGGVPGPRDALPVPAAVAVAGIPRDEAGDS